jgi:hypothetical protein
VRGGFVLIGIFSLALSSCGQSGQPNPVDEYETTNQASTNAAIAAPSTELPNYAEREGDTYLYTTAVSEEEQKRGQAVGNVVIYRYRGEKDGVHVLENVGLDGRVTTISECSEPCRIIRSRYRGTLDRIPFDSTSVIGSAFEDAIAGRLQIARPSNRTIASASEKAAGDKPSLPQTFIGEWNTSLRDCGTGLNDSRLRVEANRIRFYESEGTFTAITVHSPRSVTIKASLSGEGETWEDTYRMELSVHGQDLTIDGLTRHRCP